jgi:type II secretory pathway pseudopilin PulG
MGSVCRGATLLETLLVIGIVAVLISLILPAVMQVRAAADRLRCCDNVRQMGLAIHLYAQQRGGRLPSLTPGANGDPRESMFFAILPYLEHGNYYEQTKATGKYSGDYTMKQYLCYADPSVAWPDARSRTNYAANAQVFSAVNRRLPMLATTYRDGSSTTIAIAEHYAMCPGNTFDWFVGETMEFPPIPEFPNGHRLRRAAFADFLPGERPYDPAQDDVHPVTSGSPPTSSGSVAGLTFQVRPRTADADARIAQTAHQGMVVGMGDASLRILHRNTTPTVYWALVTPAGAEPVTLTD